MAQSIGARFLLLVAALTLSVLGRGAARGDERAAAAPPDKSQFTLFDRTPRELMREMSTDRPDTTESPYTVDAGHFQVEMSIAQFTRDRAEGVKTETLEALPVNIKAGLLNNVDVQLLIDPYVNQRVKSAGRRSSRDDGFGDTTLRLKVNLLGNDGGPIAVGVMPFVKFPTAVGALGNGRAEGGLIVALAAALPGGFDVGTMAEFDVLRDAANRGYGTAVLHTLTLGHELYGPFQGYVEYAGTAPIDTGETYQAVLGAGMTLGLGPDVQLDAGVNVGLSDSADDIQAFVGVSFRV
jgi:hypothetical protein